MDHIILVQNVTKEFKRQRVLDNVSVGFPTGGIYGLVGRNGSGKTMLMKCICGFIPPTSGEIFIQDKQVRYGSQFPKEIGFIIEAPGFLRTSSGIANLKHLASINNKIGINEVREAMKTVGLDPDSRKHVGRYSLGMRQRLSIAQAIMDKPDILILDEPMNGLDNNGVAEMRELFLKLKSAGKTLIIASHNHEDIEVLCDRVYEMDNGKLTG